MAFGWSPLFYFKNKGQGMRSNSLEPERCSFWGWVFRWSQHWPLGPKRQRCSRVLEWVHLCLFVISRALWSVRAGKDPFCLVQAQYWEGGKKRRKMTKRKQMRKNRKLPLTPHKKLKLLPLTVSVKNTPRLKSTQWKIVSSPTLKELP